MNFPTDITQELRKCELRRKRKRALAWAGMSLAIVQFGMFIGIVLATGRPITIVAGLALVAWELWALNYLTCR